MRLEGTLAGTWAGMGLAKPRLACSAPREFASATRRAGSQPRSRARFPWQAVICFCTSSICAAMKRRKCSSGVSPALTLFS
ncbi:hypothetical protein B5F76_12385 [Desulfovibrio sp. An276]|nr:hypothetical protein B5F76_12385 [Desulfovibrio sp. An276]